MDYTSMSVHGRIEVSVMSGLYGGKGAAVVLVLLLMAGSVGIFLIGQVLNSVNPDPYNFSEDYTFTGTLDDRICTGTGSTRFCPENDNYHLYQFDITVSSVSRTENMSIALIFDKDDTMVSNIYKHIGKDLVDGVQVDVYDYGNNGIDYRLYVGEKCRLIKIDITAEDRDIVGTIAD